MNELQEYQREVDAYDPDLFIGSLVWYSVPKTAKIPYVDLNKKIIEVFGAFDTPMPLPRMPKSSDVFKRACSSMGTPAYTEQRFAEDGTEQTIRYTINDAGNDDYGTYREIVREVLNQDQHELSHSTLGKLTYVKATEELSFQRYPTADGDTEVLNHIVTAIREYYSEFATMVGHSGIRYMILDAIKKAFRGYQARSSGGIYFVNAAFGPQLDALSEALSEIESSDGKPVEFHIVPLVNNERQKIMLREAFTSDVKQRFHEISKELAKIIKSGEKVSPKRVNSIKAKFRDAKKLIAEQEEILEDGLNIANDSAKILDKQFVKLLGQIRIPDSTDA